MAEKAAKKVASKKSSANKAETVETKVVAQKKASSVKTEKKLDGKALARINNLRVSPRKLRLLANIARGKDVQTAIEAVRYTKRKLANEVVKLIRSAVNNASQKRGVNVDKLYVKTVFVDQGPVLKRFMARARGSGAGILKRMSHMTVIVDERL